MSDKKVDLNKYKEFVEKVTSLQSNETGGLTSQLEKLEKESGVNMALLPVSYTHLTLPTNREV